MNIYKDKNFKDFTTRDDFYEKFLSSLLEKDRNIKGVELVESGKVKDRNKVLYNIQINYSNSNSKIFTKKEFDKKFKSEKCKMNYKEKEYLICFDTFYYYNKFRKTERERSGRKRGGRGRRMGKVSHRGEFRKAERKRERRRGRRGRGKRQ